MLSDHIQETQWTKIGSAAQRDSLVCLNIALTRAVSPEQNPNFLPNEFRCGMNRLFLNSDVASGGVGKFFICSSFCFGGIRDGHPKPLSFCLLLEKTKLRDISQTFSIKTVTQFQ